MEPKTGLLSLWVLIMFLAVPYRPTRGCKVVERIRFTKFIMADLGCFYLDENVKNIKCWADPIPELDLKTPVSTKDKIQKGACGFSFISDALGLIYDHQRDIHKISNKIFHIINTTKQELSRSENCLIEQCRNKTKPVFNHDDMFSRLQWGRTIIESSIVFMEQLGNVVKPTHKNLTSGSDHKHPHHSHNCTIHKCYNSSIVIQGHKYGKLCAPYKD